MRIHRSGRSPCIEVALLLVAVSLHSAGAQLLGPEFQVNSYTTSSQYRPAVAADSFGNFVVVWSDAARESVGVFGQGFDPAGAPLGGEFHVNSFTPGQQRYPAIAASGSNNFLVVWDSAGEDGSARGIFGRRFSAAGLPVGSAFMVNTYTTGYQTFPAAATDANGFFVVVWSGTGPTDSYGVFGQRFNLAGSTVGGEFRVNSTTPGSQQEAAVAADGLGNFVVVWASGGQDGSNYGVFGQRFDSVGTPFGGEFQVNTYTTNQQREPTVAADGAGNFVVSWISYGQDDGSNWGVYAQRFAATGVKAGPEFRVNSYTTSAQFISRVAADAAGNFVVMWEGVGLSDNDAVFGQRFTSAGATVGGEFRVNSYTTGGQRRPAVAPTAQGNFVVGWESYGQDGSSLGIFGRQITVNLFAHGFENNPPFWSATTANMCAGFCDSIAPSGCSCEAFCAANFDCCLDTCQTCGYCGP
ncbi:MAG: hypothetical protein ABI689_17690 [Thermoanaerobaculia bacterium]